MIVTFDIDTEKKTQRCEIISRAQDICNFQVSERTNELCVVPLFCGGKKRGETQSLLKLQMFVPRVFQTPEEFRAPMARCIRPRGAKELLVGKKDVADFVAQGGDHGAAKTEKAGTPFFAGWTPHMTTGKK